MSLEEAILKTLAYGKGFGVRLSGEQIRKRLIGDRIYADRAIKSKIKSLKIESQKSKNQEYFRKIDLAKELAKEIEKRFKDILFIGVSGSVAAERPKAEEDIDLLIICKANRLWITRLLLRWYVFVKNIPHRKLGKEEKRDEFCFNLWLDMNNLKLPKEKRNLKNAVDLILMVPLLNKNETYEKFICKNDWAKKYVANGYKKIKSKLRISKTEEKDPGKKILNLICYWGQLLYIRQHSSNKWIGEGFAYFHDEIVKRRGTMNIS